MTPKRLLVVLSALISVAWPGFSQSLSPDGDMYTPAGPLPGYEWVSGVRALITTDNFVLRDGNEFWAVKDPAECAMACRIFPDCEAFQFSEPLLKNDAPVCHMLDVSPDLQVASGVHVYVKTPPPLPPATE